MCEQIIPAVTLNVKGARKAKSLRIYIDSQKLCNLSRPFKKIKIIWMIRRVEKKKIKSLGLSGFGQEERKLCTQTLIRNIDTNKEWIGKNQKGEVFQNHYGLTLVEKTVVKV